MRISDRIYPGATITTRVPGHNFISRMSARKDLSHIALNSQELFVIMGVSNSIETRDQYCPCSYASSSLFSVTWSLFRFSIILQVLLFLTFPNSVNPLIQTFVFAHQLNLLTIILESTDRSILRRELFYSYIFLMINGKIRLLFFRVDFLKFWSPILFVSHATPNTARKQISKRRGPIHSNECIQVKRPNFFHATLCALSKMLACSNAPMHQCSIQINPIHSPKPHLKVPKGLTPTRRAELC